jgi:hypothetical protein
MAKNRHQAVARRRPRQDLLPKDTSLSILFPHINIDLNQFLE